MNLISFSFRHSIASWLHLIRVNSLPVIASFPIIGALYVSPNISFEMIFRLFTIGSGLHLFGFILNDVFDQKYDAVRPYHTDKPLLNGAIQARQAWLACGVVGIFTLILSAVWFGFQSVSYLLLIAAFATALLYDYSSKRMAIPPIADGTLGVCCGLLIIYGGSVIGDVNRTMLPALYLALSIAWINGAHGSLKDLDYDEKTGAYTTALWLGVRLRDNKIRSTNKFKTYCMSLVVSALVVGALEIHRTKSDYTIGEFWLISTIYVVMASIVLFENFRLLQFGEISELRVQSSLRSGVAYMILVLFAAYTRQWAIQIAVVLLPIVWRWVLNYFTRGLEQRTKLLNDVQR